MDAGLHFECTACARCKTDSDGFCGSLRWGLPKLQNCGLLTSSAFRIAVQALCRGRGGSPSDADVEGLRSEDRTFQILRRCIMARKLIVLSSLVALIVASATSDAEAGRRRRRCCGGGYGGYGHCCPSSCAAPCGPSCGAPCGGCNACGPSCGAPVSCGAPCGACGSACNACAAGGYGAPMGGSVAPSPAQNAPEPPPEPAQR
jgi:hypothetical protein